MSHRYTHATIEPTGYGEHIGRGRKKKWVPEWLITYEPKDMFPCDRVLACDVEEVKERARRHIAEHNAKADAEDARQAQRITVYPVAAR